jgi:hypothetical protein
MGSVKPPGDPPEPQEDRRGESLPATAYQPGQGQMAAYPAAGSCQEIERGERDRAWVPTYGQEPSPPPQPPHPKKHKEHTPSTSETTHKPTPPHSTPTAQHATCSSPRGKRGGGRGPENTGITPHPQHKACSSPGGNEEGEVGLEDTSRPKQRTGPRRAPLS